MTERYIEPFIPENPGPLDEDLLQMGLHVPLSIAPVELAGRQTIRIDGHHSAGFPSTRADLGAGMERSHARDDLRVVRWARVQEERRALHDRYHWHYDGVEIPHDEHERFLTVTLHSASYVAAHGVDLRGKEPVVIRYSPEQLAQLQLPGVLHQEEGTKWQIGHYFGRYLLKYGIDYMADSPLSGQFLEAQDMERRRLGHQLLRLAAVELVAPIEGVYQRARQEGRISERQPRTALRFLMLHFGERKEDYFTPMDEALQQAA